MDPVFLRLRRGDGVVATYPLSALNLLEHGTGHQVFAVVGSYTWTVARCRDVEECEIVEDLLLHRIAQAVRAPPERSACPAILDLARIAAEILADLRDDEAEARAMAEVEAMLDAAERDRETGYDGVRPDHSDVDCRGGDA